MNFYKKTVPRLLKNVFDLGIPFRSKFLSFFIPVGLYKEGEYVTIRKTWFDISLKSDLSYYIERQIFFYDIYEPEVISFILFAVDKNMICLDLGANIGLHSIFLARKAKRVVAYEVNPRIIPRWKENIRINNIENVVLVEKAISTSDGDATFYVPDENYRCGDGSLFNALDGVDSRPIKTDADSMKKVLLERGPFDIIKIDVEGLEFELISSAIDILRKHYTTLIFEYNYQTWDVKTNNPKSLNEFFNLNGYELYEIKEGYRRRRSPFDPELLSFPSQKHLVRNVVALNKGSKLYNTLLEAKKI